MALLTFDFGGTSVKYSVWDNEQLSEPVASFDTPDNWETTKEKLAEIKQSYDKKYDITGAAFSFPGCVMHDEGTIAGHSAIPFIHRFPIRAELEQLLGVPAAMENDANCATLAEVWKGVAKGKKNVLFVVVGTGIGGGVVVDGKIRTGAHLHGGEWGFMYLDYDPAADMGRSFSDVGSAVRMAQYYCERIGEPHGTYSGKQVFEKAKQGDPIAQEEVNKFYHYLSMGIYNLQMSFDPETIVIGGGISASPEIIEELTKRINRFMWGAYVRDFTVDLRACQYGNDANLIGAVKNYIDRIK